MGVTLQYTSRHPVAEEIAKAVRLELRRQRREQPWILCEPPRFYEPMEDGKLRGGTKLHMHLSADEMAPATGRHVGPNDVQELLNLLCDWSDRHGITWLLDIDGHHLGRIEDGLCRGDVLAKLEAIADVALFLGEGHPQEQSARRRDDEIEPPGNTGLRIWPGPE
jgi:hypothetical protein